MKYDIWKVRPPGEEAENQIAAGYPALLAKILAARGARSLPEAETLLCRQGELPDPFLLPDMDKAVSAIREAIRENETIAVFGDYDVDGITATSLLTRFLEKEGARCIPYIPARLEEGYGLNPFAIRYLYERNVRLIVTVDCGITAIDEANLCRQLGIRLVITDHHACKDCLPEAVAVVDPHRPDSRYPHKDLSGVGVAFKLASAMRDPKQVLDDYGDLACLGTVADVMPLRGENRTLVFAGLEAMRTDARPGLRALMEEAGVDPETLTTATIGYSLAPRINAAGRMGKVEQALNLFLSDDAHQAREYAQMLCELNRDRQAVEAQIYEEAIGMLPVGVRPGAIVLADESWHQGVAGIVASRLAEEYCCPAFLICLGGEHGKASSRSYGGFNLFEALTKLSPLLESYGGHALAAGFTIAREQIPAFREAVVALAAEYYAHNRPRTVLEADCVIDPSLFCLEQILPLAGLEPCGSGCPKPTLIMEDLTVEQISPVGGGKHLRLHLSAGETAFPAIFFSATARSASICPGDRVDAAFVPQINVFRGEQIAQMNIMDIRPHCDAPCDPDQEDYLAYTDGALTPQIACRLTPDRARLACVWRYLASLPGGAAEDTPVCLCRKIVRRTGMPLSLSQFMICVDIFAQLELLEKTVTQKTLTLRLLPTEDKRDLQSSPILQALIAAKES